MQETQANSSLSGPNDSLGATLRSAREAHGLSVHKAAQDMHVSDEIIVALEQDDFESLGAPIFVRGHLRNYARLLGLPEDEILAAEHTADKLAPPPLITQPPGGMHAFGQRFAMPVFSIIVIVLLLVLGLIWWQHRPVDQTATTLAEHAVITTSKHVMPAPEAVSTHQGMAANAHDTSPDSTVVKAKEADHKKTASGYIAQEMQKTATTPEEKTAEPAKNVQITENSAAAIPASQLIHAQFTLSQPSWVEVYDASGKRLYYNLAPAGDTLQVSGAGPLQVFLGNAPGVSVDMNGAVFNLTPFIHPDNTARFRLGAATSDSGSAG
jgi:cytoskeleton protein RodZ